MNSLVLCLALGVAMVDTSAGTIAAIVAIVWIVFRQGAVLVSGLRTIDLLAIVAAAIVLASPHWMQGRADELVRASYGPAVNLCFFVVARHMLGNHANMMTFLRGTVVVTLGYSIYFLVYGEVLSAETARRTVDFANPNYTGAVLAFGMAVLAWWIRSTATRGLRLTGTLAALILLWAILATGSRASLAGAALAIGILVVGPRIAAFRLTMIGLVAAFSVGFLPQLDFLIRSVSEPISALPFVGREGAAILDASGRFELWSATRAVIGDAWFFGWGPERYRFQPGGPQYLAHSWGLEYMASVGLLGTVFLVAILAMALMAPYRSRSADGLLLTASTALSLAPSLMLSTHQWTLWLWVAVAIWSSSNLPGPRVVTVRMLRPTGRPMVRRSERNRTIARRSAERSSSFAEDRQDLFPPPG